MATPAERKQAWQGMNWCRPSTRLAIYLRDGMACVWCAASVDDGARLTLDHLRPTSRGGTNTPANLVTACLRCNSARGDLSIAAFAARRTDSPAATMALVTAVRNRARRVLPRAQARELLARRAEPTNDEPGRAKRGREAPRIAELREALSHCGARRGKTVRGS